MKKSYALVVLAAGIGSRYGGIKQLEKLGAHGEVIMDYSVRDAVSAGFNKIVFIIRKEIEEDFWEIVGNRLKAKYSPQGIDISCVMQNIDDLPPGYIRPAQRVKPWGTCHALLACRGKLNCPFAVINADDYYGPTSFVAMMEFLSSLPESSRGAYCMVGFKLKNTLSSFGGVIRGICNVDDKGNVIRVEETRGVICAEDGSIVAEGKILDGDSTVSMNMWGCTGDIIEIIHERFGEFLDENINSLSEEFLIPELMDELLREKKISIRLLHTNEKWYGVTYKGDIPKVREALQALADE
ncbi:MAG: nucleotidyltransferase [Oscillospiraceae bacterium]|nr:nucleotidyltransferase [Oscillospiraceae bacterium]